MLSRKQGCRTMQLSKDVANSMFEASGRLPHRGRSWPRRSCNYWWRSECQTPLLIPKSRLTKSEEDIVRPSNVYARVFAIAQNLVTWRFYNQFFYWHTSPRYKKYQLTVRVFKTEDEGLFIVYFFQRWPPSIWIQTGHPALHFKVTTYFMWFQILNRLVSLMRNT